MDESELKNMVGMRKRIKQRDMTDCGAACLASVAAFYNLKVPVARIRQYASTDKKGTNVLGLIEAADKLGFVAKGVRGEWESLFKIPKPAIAHIIKREIMQHFVVVTRTTKRFIEIMDPEDGGYHKLTFEDFRSQWTGVLVLLAPGGKFTCTGRSVSLQARIIQLLKPHSGVLIQSLSGALVFSVLGLSMSIYVGKIVDYVLPGGNINLLNLLGVAMISITLLRLLLSCFQSLFILKTGQKLDASLILGYYQHLLKLPTTFFNNMRTGEIISRIGDAVKIRLFINDVSINLILNIFILIVSFALMFTFNWRLALIMVGIIPFFMAIYYISNRLNRVVQRKIMERAAELEAHLVESISSAETIKRFSIEDYSNYRTETKFVNFLEPIYKSGLNNIFSSGTTSLTSQLITIALLWAGAGFAINSQISPGELLSFYTLTGYITAPVASIIAFNRTYQDARIAADRLFEIFDLETDLESGKMSINHGNSGDIQFENVSFRYGTRVDVFDSFNLRIKKGEITAITGESGSGKSTLISLILKMYPVNNGIIRIGNTDINNISNKSLRKHISVVPQSIDIFAGTVLENIALGEFYPDMEKVVQVCQDLGMTTLIEEMPHGFFTFLGEKGVSLSGGQKQKIGIARAFYREPEIMILDEATSAMDSFSEEFVQKSICSLRNQGKTVIVIAHRLATLKLAERIIVLEKGMIMQDGTFEELSTSKGLFQKMWSLQSSEIRESLN